MNVTIKNEALKKSVSDLFIILIGISLYVIGFCVFVLPHHVVIGGMTGLGTLVYFATMEKVPIAVTMYGANLLLLLIGLKILGKGFLLRAIYGATMISVLIGAVEGYFTAHPPLVTSAPMSLIMGSVLMGLVIGVYYSHNGTSGGSDIVAAIMAHKTTISMGRVLMIMDMTIVAFSFLLPFEGDMEMRIQVRTETIIYGWVSIFIYSNLADRYMTAGKQTIQFFVLSDKWEDIAYRVSHETHRGVTLWDAKGYWTGEKRTMMVMWCRKYDIESITKIVTECDQHAFISINNVKGVYGNGFDHLRVPKHHSIL